MKIRIASDLHLEMTPYLEFPQLPEDKDTVMVLAGDIFRCDKAEKKYAGIPVRSIIKHTTSQFRDVIHVMGNHEHWGGSIARSRIKIEQAMNVPVNFHMLNNETVVIDNVAFIGSTLWTDYNNDPSMMHYAETGGMDGGAIMMDFRRIRWGSTEDPYKRKLRAVHTVALHMRAKEFIFPEIAKQKELGRKTVVVTHHAPSYQSLQPQFRVDRLHGAYASELGWQITDAEPDVWIHGHVHDSLDYMIHKTRVICNPRGYAGYDHGCNHSFDPAFLLEI